MQELRVELENGDHIKAAINEQGGLFYLDEIEVIGGRPASFSRTHPKVAHAGSCFDILVSVALAFSARRKSPIEFYDNPNGTPMIGKAEQMSRRRMAVPIRVRGI